MRVLIFIACGFAGIFVGDAIQLFRTYGNPDGMKGLSIEGTLTWFGIGVFVVFGALRLRKKEEESSAKSLDGETRWDEALRDEALRRRKDKKESPEG